MRRIALIVVVLFSFMLLSTTVFSADVKQTGIDTVKGAAKGEAKQNLIDINSASKEQLMSIPGIGDAYSKKIIDGRPYKNKSQLKSKKIIPAATYDKIKDMIIAKQPK